MYIADEVRSLLLDPVLANSLSIPVDDFVLKARSADVQLAATLRLSAGAFGLELRDSEGRDLRSFFPSGRKFTAKDTLSATGSLGNRLPVEFRQIWPPHCSTMPLVGSVCNTSAKVSAKEIHVIRKGHDCLTSREILERLEKLNYPKAQHEEAVCKESRDHEFEHLAVLANTKLEFFNGGIEWTESHPFWGKSSRSSVHTWDGEALGGKFSLKQAGDHLEVGFLHRADDDAAAQERFEALLEAVAYTHAVFPWPSFTQRQRDGEMMQRTLKVVNQIQGSMFPIRQRDGVYHPDAPTNLIASVAALFCSLPIKAKSRLKRSLWVFRGADSMILPVPVQMVAICAVIEGLCSELCSTGKEPESFTRFKSAALSWSNDLLASWDISEKEAIEGRFRSRIRDWHYQDRKVEWFEAFGPLFPGMQDWLEGLYKLFQKHRNRVAHGRFDIMDDGNPHEIIEALGRLSGFANAIVAAKSGYRGPILESAFSDERMSLE